MQSCSTATEREYGRDESRKREAGGGNKSRDRRSGCWVAVAGLGRLRSIDSNSDIASICYSRLNITPEDEMNITVN